MPDCDDCGATDNGDRRGPNHAIGCEAHLDTGRVRIHLAEKPWDHSVHIDDRDISRYVTAIHIEAAAEHPPAVLLELAPGYVTADIDIPLHDARWTCHDHEGDHA